ncbi:MAG: acyltransferase [Lachnospiraceae bacterium]|nr:acyltransferase [Lachnospiraceae bacterium]
MNKWAKILILAAAAALLVRIHMEKKKQMGAGWAGYGKQLLGLGAVPPGRRHDLDELRFLAAVLVILVHSFQSGAAQLAAAGLAGGLGTGSGGALDGALGAGSGGGSGAWLWMFLTGAAGLGLCCNLLFVFLSGALLLPYREESAGTFYRKRFSKVVIPLAAYYLFYLRRSGLFSFTPDSIGNALRTILSGPNELVPHFWLVYVLAGLYVGVPFLRRMLKALPDCFLESLERVIILGAAVQTGLHLLGISLGINSFLLSWEGIFLLGYLWSREGSRKREWAILAGGAASAAVIIWLFLNRTDASVVAANQSVFMILFASAVFIWFRKRRRSENQRQKVWSVVRIGSRYSYSILLIHWFMLFVVTEKHLHIGPMMFGGSWILAGILLQSVTALGLSLVFAVVFDQTMVVLAEWLWETAWGLWGKVTFYVRMKWK